jgi:hypothetical protein
MQAAGALVDASDAVQALPCQRLGRGASLRHERLQLVDGEILDGLGACVGCGHQEEEGKRVGEA